MTVEFVLRLSGPYTSAAGLVLRRLSRTIARRNVRNWYVVVDRFLPNTIFNVPVGLEGP